MIFKYLFKSILLIFSMLIIYIAISFMSLFITNIHTHIKADKEIYIYHDLVHTEIIMEVAYFKKEFFEKFPSLIKQNSGYIIFSFGDKDFLMKVPNWNDLKIAITLKSLFINTPALIRVSNYRYINKKESVKIKITDKELEALKNSILNSFLEKKGKFVRYFDHYKQNDTQYFNAKQAYNLFYTCNSWTGDRLKDAKLTQPFITPFPQQVIYPF